MKNRAVLFLAVSTFVLGSALAPHAAAADLFWDADGDVSAATGGTATWAIGSGGAWRLGSSTGATQVYDNTSPSSITAQFGGSAGTVTLSGTINAGGINFLQSGYTLTAGTLNINPASSPFVYTTNGGTSTINSTITSPGSTQITKTGAGTLVIGTGGGGVNPNPALYKVTGGTLNGLTGVFDSILAMPAGNRLGYQAGTPTTVLTLDAGTFQVTSATGNALAVNRKVLVNAAGGSIVDFGSNNFYEPEIVNNAGVGSSLYLSNGSGNTEFRGIISGSGSVTWTGAASTNMAVFKAANSYTGATTVNGGTLKLDFTGTNTGASRLSSSTAVKLNGGTLSLLGTATAGQTTSQTINGLTISGAASVVDTVGAAGLASSLALGNITRTNLGTLNITLPATGNITSTKANTGGIIGGWATVGGTDWAATTSDGITPGNITALASYLTTTVAGNTASNYLPTSNVDVTSTPTLSGAVTVNSLRFNSAAANTLNLTGTNVVATGGVLVTAVVGANASAIDGGTLEGSAGGDLTVIQNNTAGTLTIGSLVADNTTATALTKSGAGTLILNNSNAYTGGTTLASGILSVAQNGALGTGALTFTTAATLQAGGTNVSLSNTINLGLTSDVFDTNGNTLTLNGDISNSGAVNNPIKAAGTGTLVLAGTLNVTGHASDTNNPALMMGNRNGANFNRGTVSITGTGNISRISTGWDNTANVFNFASTGTVTMTTDFVSGQSANGVGVFNFTSGTLNLQNLNMANWDGSYGAFTMSDGTINTTNLRNGGNGNGNGSSYSLMTGGTINVAEVTTLSRNGTGTNVLYINGVNAQFNEGNNRFNLGFSTGSTGVVTVANGLLAVGSNLSIAEGGTGTTGVVNLNGGIVRPNVIVAPNAAGTSIFNFNGGTLQANISSVSFMGGLTGANIFTGGAVIDSNGAAVTISQALQGATGDGVSVIPVSTGGAGYLGAPVVKITGGGGTGATAVATISGGAVTGIQITSSGTGYTSTPTVTLIGGGPTTAATLGTATTSANAADGGLRKIGFGTLSLTGASTYLGTTTVEEGVLATNNLQANGTASSIGKGTNLILNGGTFRYTGASNGNGFNRSIAIGANGGTVDIAITGFVFYDGSFIGSDPLTFMDSSGQSGELLVTGNSPGLSSNVYVGNGSSGSGMVQYRSNNANPFGTGTIQIDGGGIFSSDNGVTAPSTLANNFVLNGGRLATQLPDMNYTGAITLESGSSVGHPVNYPGSTGRITLSGVISGESWADLTISTAASVTLANTNTYTGFTYVNAGTLLVNGSTSADSAIMVADNAILGGTGTVHGPVETVGANSRIAPGAGGIGILNTGNTVLTGILATELDATGSDKLNVTGDLDVTGATVTFTPLATPAAEKYVIAKYTGTLTGTLSSSTVPAGYALTHDAVTKEIRLSPSAGFSGFMDGFPSLSTAQKLPGADPDGDGVSNLIEYALAGFDPTVANGSPGSLVGMVVTYTKRAEAVANGGLTYAIVKSATLGVAPSPWSAVVPDVNNSTTISYTLPTGQPKEFVRLEVIQN